MGAEIVTEAAAGTKDRRRWIALAVIVAAPVVRVSLSRDQAALLERVEERDEPAGIERERVGDRCLRLTGALGEDRQDAVVVGVEPFFFDSFSRLRFEGEAEPGEQEAAAGDEFLRHPVNRADRAFSGRSCHRE